MKLSSSAIKRSIYLLILVLFWPSNSLAAESTEEQFNKLIVEAVTARNQGNMEAALTALQKAYELQPMPELLNNMGRVLEDQGQYIKAHQMYKRVVDDGSVGLGLRGMSSGRMGALNNKITRGWVVVTTADENTEIWIDGQPYQNASGEVGTGPGSTIFEIHAPESTSIFLRFQELPVGVRTPISVDTRKAEASDGSLAMGAIPGPLEKLQIGGYTLQSKAAGLEKIHLPPNTYKVIIQPLGASPVTLSAVVRSGESLDLTASYQAQRKILDARMAGAPTGPGIMPWILSGSGVVLLGVGGYFAYSASQDQTSINNATNSDSVVEGMTQKNTFSTNDSANSKGTLGNVFLGVGLAATLGGTLWWLLSEHPAAKGSTSVVSASRSTTRLNLIPGWGISLDGSF